MKKAVYAVNNVLDKIMDVLETITGYLLLAFIAMLFFQVVMRFVFSNPIYGIDEAVVALMVWTMCIGWCTVYWQNGHAVLEFIVKRLPNVPRKVLFNIINVTVVWLSWVYVPASYTLFNMQKKMPPVGGLPFCKGYYYALPVLVMGILMVILSVHKTIAFLITGDESICVPVEKEGGGVLD